MIPIIIGILYLVVAVVVWYNMMLMCHDHKSTFKENLRSLVEKVKMAPDVALNLAFISFFWFGAAAVVLYYAWKARNKV